MFDLKVNAVNKFRAEWPESEFPGNQHTRLIVLNNKTMEIETGGAWCKKGFTKLFNRTQFERFVEDLRNKEAA